MQTITPSHHRDRLMRPTIAVAIDPEELPVVWEIPWSGRVVALKKIVYSIRLPDHPGRVECARCDKTFQAFGPTGHADKRPICDECLLQCEKELGMVLALVSVARIYARVKCGSAREHWQALEDVAAFAHVYEQFAALRSGPVRVFRPDLDS